MSGSFSLTKITGSIEEHIQNKSLGSLPIESLVESNEFVPKEGWLWDYKSDIPRDKLALAKTVKHIVSFHNTCGGYIVYGVSEIEKDRIYVPIDIDFSDFDQAKLRDNLANYLTRPIDISFSECELSIGNKTYKMGSIHIPKRGYDSKPVAIQRNGPDVNPRKPLFSIDEVYLRDLDQCKQAKTVEHWQTLMSPRLVEDISGASFDSEPSTQPIDHDLPDKNLICANFLGRGDVIADLWQWIADPFNYTKILAGDGGKGKTSIAYQFCSSFILKPPSGFERVVWMSAKQEQFSGLDNTFYQLNDANFECSKTFLLALAENCAIEADSLEDVSSQMLKREVQIGLEEFPSLIVVDDVDSLDEDEQKIIVDFCRQLGKDKVRFLITTRKKFAYSSDSCIEVSGFSEPEFEQYIVSLVSDYGLKELTKKEISQLHDASDGSPLLSGSILRILKMGEKFPNALREWKGKLGEDARDAALSREIKGLSVDSKRVLLAIFYFKSCSLTELKQAVAMESTQFLDSLEQLRSLFLINEPRITSGEERFSISNTTALIVEANIKKMAYDHAKIRSDIKKMRTGVAMQPKQGNRLRVGKSISQAMAFLHEEEIEKAIDSLDAELSKQKNHPDLLAVKARCLMSMDEPDYDAIGKHFQSAYIGGHRKSIMFEHWYEAENKRKSPNGMIDVALKSLESGSSGVDDGRWRYRLARGYVLRSSLREEEDRVSDLMEASAAMSKSVHVTTGTQKNLWFQELCILHDLTWKKMEESRLGWLSMFDYLSDMVHSGDERKEVYLRAKRCLLEFKDEKEFSESREKAYSICVSKFVKLVKIRSKEFLHSEQLDDVLLGL